VNELKRRRIVVALVVFAVFAVIGVNPGFLSTQYQAEPQSSEVLSRAEGSELAISVLDRLEIKGRAPKTGYSRSEFGNGWARVQGCDIRNIMLSHNMSDTVIAEDECVVLSGVLQDPYTGVEIEFQRGSSTSNKVQIDHVVALSDSWQKGAQNISYETRNLLANDPLNLLAVDGPANQQKGDSDAASWLPPNKSFRCRYVARQVAVKDKYSLWLSEAEYSAIKRILNGCGEQVVPVEL